MGRRPGATRSWPRGGPAGGGGRWLLLPPGQRAHRRGLDPGAGAGGRAGVSVSPLRSVDLTRRFSQVRFDDVRLGRDNVVGEVGAAGPEVASQRRTALALAVAESVGAMQAAFDMTAEWAFDRYSFGRPLASYQEIKHRFADMKTWLEVGHAASDEAGRPRRAVPRGRGELLSAAKSFVGDYGSELLQDACRSTVGSGSLRP